MEEARRTGLGHSIYATNLDPEKRVNNKRRIREQAQKKYKRLMREDE